MPKRLRDEPARRGGSGVSWLQADPRGVLVRVDEVTRCDAPFDVALDRVEQLHVLGLVVERSNHHVASLMACKVEAVVPHDEAPNAVILDVDPAHIDTLGREVRRHNPKRTHAAERMRPAAGASLMSGSGLEHAPGTPGTREGRTRIEPARVADFRCDTM